MLSGIRVQSVWYLQVVDAAVLAHGVARRVALLAPRVPADERRVAVFVVDQLAARDREHLVWRRRRLLARRACGREEGCG